ncbi:MAG TPA: recombinase family protein [Candidatus Saccharimonadales bacterium]|nr:recombinase family protein [Candidatus Saccharimonadales bacterium]
MSRTQYALALCRVSSIEQLKNNSLNRQRDAVLKAAQELGVVIPDDGWWSGSVSSKRGTNTRRKDLSEIIDRCKKDKRIKYLVVDEPDRFMRSIDEAAYFEVTFKELGVMVWYASDPELNKGDLASKLLKFTKYLSAEGSNEERQNKSISGQTKALQMGRYPGSPKPGYKRGYERAIQEVHPTRGPALQTVLIRIANHLVTPTQGLIELNASEFMNGHATYKMDKFRKIVTDPFYAGILEINRQVKVRNENGLHEALITKDQHYELVRIMDGKKKTQSGPRKNGNPEYPLSNHVSCDLCQDKRNGRFVGFKHSNGKNIHFYHKYRCRVCKRYLTRDDLHTQVERYFKQRPITKQGLKDILDAIDIVWKEKEGQMTQSVTRIRHRIDALGETIANQAEAVADPSNVSIKEELLAAIAKKRKEITELEDELSKIKSEAEYDRERFLQFAFGFIKNMGTKFLEISPENRMRCKLILFPAGFYVDANKIVYTPEISPLYRLVANKKDTEVSSKSHLVHYAELFLHEIRDELTRWRIILAVPYREHLSSK